MIDRMMYCTAMIVLVEAMLCVPNSTHSKFESFSKTRDVSNVLLDMSSSLHRYLPGWYAMVSYGDIERLNIWIDHHLP